MKGKRSKCFMREMARLRKLQPRDKKTGRLMCLDGINVCDPRKKSAEECMYCGD